MSRRVERRDREVSADDGQPAAEHLARAFGFLGKRRVLSVGDGPR